MPMWKGKAHSCSSCLYKTMGMVSQKKTSEFMFRDGLGAMQQKYILVMLSIMRMQAMA